MKHSKAIKLEVDEREDDKLAPCHDTVKSHPKKIPIEIIIHYANKGFTSYEIAKQLNCSRQNINQRLNAIGWNKEAIDSFKQNRADIQAFIQSKIAGKQIDFLAHEENKIENWNEFKAAQISKATEQDKEQIIVNINQSNTTVNRHQLIAEFKELNKDKLEAKGVINADSEDDEV